jgi:hypothetical protein
MEVADDCTRNINYGTDIHELGEIIDMIKDIDEAINYRHQALYYGTIAEGMNRPYLRHDIRGMMDDDYREHDVWRHDAKSEHDKSPEEKFESYQKSVKDIWSSATPELRSKMRTTLTKLVNDMA